MVVSVKGMTIIRDVMLCVRSFLKEKPGHFDLNFPGEAVVNQRRLKCQLVVVKTPDLQNRTEDRHVMLTHGLKQTK